MGSKGWPAQPCSSSRRNNNESRKLARPVEAGLQGHALVGVGCGDADEYVQVPGEEQQTGGAEERKDPPKQLVAWACCD